MYPLLNYHRFVSYFASHLNQLRIVLIILAIVAVPFSGGGNALAMEPEDAVEGVLVTDGDSSGGDDALAAMDKGRGEMGPGFPNPINQGYSAAYYSPSAVSAQNCDFGLVRQKLNLAIPGWRNERNMMMVRAGINYTRFETDALLPDSGRVFPDELWEMSVGVDYMHQTEDKWKMMLMVNLGSASDKPFSNTAAMKVGFMGSIVFPVKNQRDGWRFSLMYEPLSDMNFPMPGAAYDWNPSENLKASFGFPFILMWRPLEDLTLNVSYFPVYNVNIEATYRLSPAIAAYASYETLRESYHLSDTEESNYRFLSSQNQVKGGFHFYFSRNITLDTTVGYAFNRYYGEGKGLFRDLRDRIDIDPEFFVSAGLSFGFE